MHLCSNIFMYQKIDNISWTLIPPNANHFEHAQNIAWNWKLSQTFSWKLSSVLESNLPAPHSSTPISPLGNVIKRLNNNKKKLNEKNLHVWSPFFFFISMNINLSHIINTISCSLMVNNENINGLQIIGLGDFCLVFRWKKSLFQGIVKKIKLTSCHYFNLKLVQ